MSDAATLGIAAAVAFGVWLLALGVLAAATRARDPDPAPPTVDLPGDESPAVVNLITNGWAVGKEAVPATLIDLAARKVVAFERVGPDQYIVRVPGSRPSGLGPYEQQVHDHVAGLAKDGVVPCEALTTGPQEESTTWWKRFTTAVADDARTRGFSRPRWARAHIVVLGTLAAAPAGLATAALFNASKSDHSVLGAIGVAVFLWVVLLAIPRSLRAERDTPLGLATAGRWLGLRAQLGGDENFAQQPPTAIAIWDRLLSYGAAMGVAAGAVRALPMGTESATEAWTAYGGRWRVVHVRYPSHIPPGWGRSPASAITLGLALLVPAAFVAYALRALADDASLISFAVFAIPLVVMAYGLTLLSRGAADVGRRAPVEGVVLRRWEVTRTNNGHTNTVAVYLAVYDGNGSEVRALRCTPQVASGVDAGDVVRATVTPRLAHVYRVDPVARRPGV